MKKLFALLILVVLVFSSGYVLAQEGTPSSPFADLADDQNKYRTVRSASGSTLQTYQQKLDEYNLLSDKYEESYGSARVEMGERVLARGKDVLVAKLGAIESHVVVQKEKLDGAGLLTDKGKAAFNDRLNSYRDFMKDFEPKINQAETVSELRSLNSSLNVEAVALLDSLLIFKAPLSILSGRTLIESLMGKSTLFQAHINAAVDAGADVSDIQYKLDEAMLNLENAKTDYDVLGDEAKTITTAAFRTSNFRNKLVRVNSSVSKAHVMLKEVIVGLEIIYGPSPWDVSNYL